MLKGLLEKILGLPKSKRILGFDDTVLYFLGCWINTNIMMGILYMDMLLEGPLDRFVALWIGIFVYMLFHWYIMRFFYLKLVENFPGYDNRVKRMLRLPLVLLIYFLVTLVLDVMLDPVLEIKDPTHQRPNLYRELITGTFMTIIDIVIYEALHLFAEFKNTKVKQAKLEKEQISSQLMNLKNQISPHFLFNSLNTLLFLIDEDKKKSKEFIHKLSYIYKSVLESSQKDLVLLKEELEYINAYAGLLKKRFGENLIFDFDIAYEDLNKKIVPLSMQLGIENAVKHNVVSKKKPLNIVINSRQDVLVIRNNIQKRSKKTNKKGLGLENIANRYKLVTNKEVSIEQNSDLFTLKLPLME